jgi:antibiotic biosynthesis monooxygenase (ABM) superfamily enzyme
MVNDSPVTITIRRRVRAGREHAFEEALREFIPRALRHPGHLGAQVLRPMPGVSTPWLVVIKFQSKGHYDDFRTCAEYAQWTAQLRDLLEEEPVYEEQSGLESWFVLPGDTSLPVLPRWKMALVTWLGVSVAVIGLQQLLGPLLSEWPYLVGALFFNALVVSLLTWGIMPLLTRLLRPWLFPRRPDTSQATTWEKRP